MKPHLLTFPDTDGVDYSRVRYHYLLQIIFGETIAIDYCRTMSTFAPNEEARAFLLKQQKEEDTHLEMLTEYVGLHPRPLVTVSFWLKRLDAVMSAAILEKKYVDCIFIQNFIVEGLNISLLRELEHHSDGVLSELCSKILHDEIGHMEFGVTELRSILKEDQSLKTRKRLLWLQRKVLLYATGLAITLAREAKHLGIPIYEFGEKTVSEHARRIEVAGFPMPFFDRILFKSVLTIFKVI